MSINTKLAKEALTERSATLRNTRSTHLSVQQDLQRQLGLVNSAITAMDAELADIDDTIAFMDTTDVAIAAGTDVMAAVIPMKVK